MVSAASERRALELGTYKLQCKQAVLTIPLPLYLQDRGTGARGSHSVAALLQAAGGFDRHPMGERIAAVRRSGDPDGATAEGRPEKNRGGSRLLHVGRSWTRQPPACNSSSSARARVGT